MNQVISKQYPWKNQSDHEANITTVEKKGSSKTNTSAGEKDLQTFAKYTKYVPFDLLHTPSPIVRDNPWSSVKPFAKPDDTERPNTIKTRPRVVMTPAFSLDDIGDEWKRKIIIEDTYKSTKMADFVAPITEKLHGPLPRVLIRPTIMTKLPSIQHRVEREWIKDTLGWDSRQERFNLCTNTEFWKRTLAK